VTQSVAKCRKVSQNVAKCHKLTFVAKEEVEAVVDAAPASAASKRLLPEPNRDLAAALATDLSSFRFTSKN
jgi:hypothetical protein